MTGSVYRLRAKVWLYQGDPSTGSGQVGAWHFVTIGKTAADNIKRDYVWPRRGFGSIPVKVRIGNTPWRTSIFPDKEGTYVLPLRKEVRAKEGIKAGSLIEVVIEVTR